jgi:hypothetical protein
VKIKIEVEGRLLENIANIRAEMQVMLSSVRKRECLQRWERGIEPSVGFWALCANSEREKNRPIYVVVVKISEGFLKGP